MQQPFNVTDDKTNTLFKLLFQNMQDKNFKVYENKTDDEILAALSNGNVCFNKTSNNMYLCVNVNGELKKIDFGGSSSSRHCVVETYRNGSSWYRIWDDGWCEQGGITDSVGYDINITITLLKAFQDTNYSVFNNILNANHADSMTVYTYSKTTTDITIHIRRNESANAGTRYVMWKACGYKS